MLKVVVESVKPDAKTVFLCSVSKDWSRGTRPAHVAVFSCVSTPGCPVFAQFALIKGAQELVIMHVGPLL